MKSCLVNYSDSDDDSAVLKEMTFPFSKINAAPDVSTKKIED